MDHEKDKEEQEDKLPDLKLKVDPNYIKGQEIDTEILNDPETGEYDVEAELAKYKEQAAKVFRNPIEGTDYTFYINPIER